MPLQLDIENLQGHGRNIYTYAADGRKLSVQHLTGSSLTDTKMTDYVGNRAYENGALKYTLFSDGYIDANYEYHFYVRDYLGNVCSVLDSNGFIVQQNDYYPFGMPFAETSNAEQDVQPYKYNGKELDRGLKLNLYDYSARQMDPALGRFTTMDPLAEKYYSISPYAYCANNPMRFVDPTGEELIIWYNDNNGKQKFFIFNGQNENNAPQNTFVSSVITAYKYNTNNGGGDNLKHVANTNKFRVNIVETGLDSKYSPGPNGTIRFNPLNGLETNDGYILSPATILEHETAHAVDYKTGKQDNTKDSKYSNISERRIIKEVEVKTAKANKELPQNHTGRKSHAEGRFVITTGVTSNKEFNRQKSEEFNKRILNFRNSWTSE